MAEATINGVPFTEQQKQDFADSLGLVRGIQNPVTGGSVFYAGENSLIIPEGETDLSDIVGGGTTDEPNIFDVSNYGTFEQNGDITAAVSAAIAAAQASIVTGYEIPWVRFPKGVYKMDGIRVPYNSVGFMGHGIGTTRLVHNHARAEPLIFFTRNESESNAHAVAAPYGGVKDLSLFSGTLTQPAILYCDVNLDIGFSIDNLGFNGIASTVLCDAINALDFLNAGARKLRFDAISGYCVRFRASSSVPSYTNRTANGHYRANALNISTGAWTITQSTKPIPGTPVVLYGFGATFPVAVDTGLALLPQQAGGVYFIGAGSTGLTVYLHRTRADAIAGVNVITYSQAYSGSIGMQLWPSYGLVSSIDSATDEITYSTFGQGFLVSTATVQAGLTNTYNAGYDAPAVQSTGGVGSVRFWSDGALPSPLAAGAPYWPIYVDATKFKLAASASDAVAGVAIDVGDTGSGNTYVMYSSDVSIFGMGRFMVDDYTMDNAGARTSETRQTTSTGGLGVLYADHSSVTAHKGTIEFRGARIEINKALARDAAMGCAYPSVFRLIPNGNMYGSYGSNIVLALSKSHIDVSTSVAQSARDLHGISTREFDLAPSIHDCYFFGCGAIYNNDGANAPSALVGYNGEKTHISLVTGKVGQRNDGRQVHQIAGVSTGQLGTGGDQSTSFAPNGATFFGAAGAAAFYRAAQNIEGFSYGTGSTSIGVTLNGTVGSNVFSIESGTLSNNAVVGTSVSIAGAGSGGAALVGVIGEIDTYGPVRTVTLLNAGLPQPCLTAVSGAVTTYSTITWAETPAYLTASAALGFPSIAAQSSADLTISVPGASAGRVVELGCPANVPAGVVYFAYVSAANTVRVRATNVTGSAVAPASGTFAVKVATT